MAQLQHIEVPLIHEDLKYNETIVEIANTLDILEHSFNNIFNHVHTSINKTKQSLKSIENRNTVIKKQIDKLKTIKKSIILQSKSKYPYENNKNYEINFEISPKLKLDKIDCSKSMNIMNENKENNYDIENKLKFYHVKTSDMLRKNVELVCDETLGKLPNNINSITSCMLFNTCENVYEKYIIIDPFSSDKKKKKIIKDTNGNNKSMEDAPQSLAQNDDNNILKRQESYVYSPSIENVPFIDLPLNLPDLNGFAQDFNYDGQQLARGLDTKEVPKSTEDVNTRERIKPSEPPKFEVKPSEHNVSNAESNIPISTTAPPPPPPPLPPPSPPPSSQKKSEPSAPPAAQSSLHANLMDAIRSAGGTGKAKLKNIGTASDSKNAAISDGKTPSNSGGGGDLMSDLAAKLMLRRKGISGQSKESSGLMDALLSKIPPPPRPGGESSGSSDRSNVSDAEWED